MARPKKVIDPTEVEKLAAMHCSNTEIAAFFDVSVDTIERRFAGIISKGKERGKSKLRRLQWESATKGNVTMQIWLGKQLLAQRDHIETPTIEAKIDGKANIVIRWTDEPDSDIGTPAPDSSSAAG